ncbi:MAG: aspartate aminotransferase family protein [Denitrovibrio sp.]|nr:MAG: aspartate aminotransferase family protein [Denitrovibrio sp.]
MKKLYNLYEDKFKTSKTLHEQAKKYFPNGVCHDIRNYPPFPMVTDKCEDIYMHDTDGNKVLDLWMGHYALLLGHGNEAQKIGVERAIEAGIHHGTLNTLQLEFAEIIQEAVPQLELMRLCTSGTEATMYVTRIARAFTKRNVIVKAEGGWHGGNSVLSNGVVPPFPKHKKIPESEQTISIPFNDVQITSDILNEYTNEVAAIIIEPMLGAGGGILASPEYLKFLREYCNKTGALLIFDEVITGFRFRFGSIAPLLGTYPDLFTFGKATAGGMHIGLYGGRKDVMNTITTQKLFTGGGTYSANPMTMAIAIETLNRLKDMDYRKLNTIGDNIRNFLVDKCQKLKIPAYATGFGSYFCLHMLTEKIEKPTPHHFMTLGDKQMETDFKVAMLVNDVFTMHAGGALSFMHLENETIDTIKQAYQNSFQMLDII